MVQIDKEYLYKQMKEAAENPIFVDDLETTMVDFSLLIMKTPRGKRKNELPVEYLLGRSKSHQGIRISQQKAGFSHFRGSCKSSPAYCNRSVSNLFKA